VRTAVMNGDVVWLETLHGPEWADAVATRLA